MIYIVAAENSEAMISAAALSYTLKELGKNVNLLGHGTDFSASAPPNLLITVGISDMAKEFSGRLNPYGFLLGIPIVNISNSQNNKKFGKINILGNGPVTEITADLINYLCL